MKYEVRLTKTYAKCAHNNCDTYNTHHLWIKMMNMHKNVSIPPGEPALFVQSKDEKFCLCRKHTLDFINSIDEGLSKFL